MAVLTTSLSALPPQLRPLNILRDLPAVANLVETCFASTLDDDGRRYLQQMRRSGKDNAFLRWASQVADTASMPLTGFVWEENGEIIGNASLIPYRRNRRKFYLIANVAVHPNQRRRGIGRLLTQAAMQQAGHKHADETWLHVRDDNPGAIALYENLGFRERARRASWRLTLDRTSRPDSPSLEISRRRKRDWPQQEEYLRRLYPETLAWYQSVPWPSLRPGLAYVLERFLLADETRHWTVRAGNDLAAALTWQPMPPNYPDRLWVAVPPSGAGESPLGGEALHALLLRARRELASWRTTLALDFPGGEYTDAIQSAGFLLHRTLLWMQLAETPENENRN
ncbi:MAG: GNAT family N-acetyltransferase [Chloroflexi bacterium]|nr:GNAT family N-acetyltransferase [Chloroflexota bacterium]